MRPDGRITISGLLSGGILKRVAVNANTQTEDAVGLLEKAVNIPSPTWDPAGVRPVEDVFLKELEALGFDTTGISLPDSLHRVGHLLARHAGKRGGHLPSLPFPVDELLSRVRHSEGRSLVIEITDDKCGRPYVTYPAEGQRSPRAR
jgi:hypothetical protein